MKENFEEHELRYNAWKQHLKKTVGDADEKVFRYFWGMYDLMMTEIKNLNNKYKFYQNGQKNDL